MRCHSHVETKYFATESLDELGDEQTKLSAAGFDCEVETVGGEDEAIKPTTYVVTASRQVCQCRCIDCGAAIQKATKAKRPGK